MTVSPIQTFLVALGLCAGALFATTSARAQDDADNYTLEDVQACSGDAMRLCRDALPDVHRIEACMEAKKAQLSKACLAMFDPSKRR